MKQSSTSSNRILTAPVLSLWLVLASGTLAAAQGNYASQAGTHRACSSRTIAGDYGFQIEGTILGPNLALRTLLMAHFDGVGTVTSVDHVVVGGQPPDPSEEWRPTSGTYTLNPDCTGSAEIDVSPGNPPLSYHFVVVDKGRQILLVVDGGAIRGTGFRVDWHFWRSRCAPPTRQLNRLGTPLTSRNLSVRLFPGAPRQSVP
jgi:hypothetical protein